MGVLLIARLIAAAGLLVMLLAAGRARAPQRPTPRGELRRLVAGAFGLYAAGVVAWLAHRALLATLVLAAGIVTAALAGWLSRGVAPEDSPSGEEPNDPGPPAPHDRGDPVDWERFDRERRNWTPVPRPAARR